MIDSVSDSHPISAKLDWNKCFIKNNQELFLDLADSILQEGPKDCLMVAFSRAHGNGSY